MSSFMKKLLLLPLFFALVFTSCNDDEGETIEPPVSEIDADMRGDWTNTMIKREYYSIEDELMYEDSVQNQTTFSFDGKRMTVTVPGSTQPEVMNYSFPDPNDSTMMEVQRGSETGKYKVISITDTEMTWLEEKEWAGFPESAPEADRTTSRLGVFTWRFVRK